MTRGAVRCSAWLGVTLFGVIFRTTTGKKRGSSLRIGLMKDQIAHPVEADSGTDGEHAKLRRAPIAWLTLANPSASEIGADTGRTLEKGYLVTSAGVTPNDPKLSDGGGTA